MSGSVDIIDSSPSFLANEPNCARESIDLLLQAEGLHYDRLRKLEEKEGILNEKLSALKDDLKSCYKQLKTESKEPVNISHLKERVLNLWNEWKESLKEKDIEEYRNLRVDLEKMDFSHMSLEELDDKLIPELEKVQKHFEYKYQKIPNELRLLIELFTILVEILKECPKSFSQLNRHITTQKG